MVTLLFPYMYAGNDDIVLTSGVLDGDVGDQGDVLQGTDIYSRADDHMPLFHHRPEHFSELYHGICQTLYLALCSSKWLTVHVSRVVIRAAVLIPSIRSLEALSLLALSICIPCVNGRSKDSTAGFRASSIG